MPRVQFTGFYFGVNIPTACYLLIDVAAVVFLTYALTCALPNETLKPDRPTASLFSAYTLSSVLGNLFFNTATFIIIQILMPLDPGYIKWPASLSSATQFWLNGEA